MTQEAKDLLLKDIGSRLSYGVKFFGYKVLYSDNVIYYDNEKLVGIIADSIISEKESFDINRVKPYLRPMSSMTRKERSTYITLLAHGPASYTVAWLDAKRFDHRVNKEGDSLIDLGLAIEVTENNNPYKE